MELQKNGNTFEKLTETIKDKRQSTSLFIYSQQ